MYLMLKVETPYIDNISYVACGHMSHATSLQAKVLFVHVCISLCTFFGIIGINMLLFSLNSLTEVERKTRICTIMKPEKSRGQ